MVDTWTHFSYIWAISAICGIRKPSRSTHSKKKVSCPACKSELKKTPTAN